MKLKNIFKILIILTISSIVLSSFEAFTVGNDDILLLLNDRRFFLSFNGFLIILTTFYALYINKFSLNKKLIYLAVTLFIVLFISIIHGKTNSYILKAFIGPELRGLFLWFCMVLFFYIYFNQGNTVKKIKELYSLIFVLLILRSFYELLFVLPKSSFTDRYLFDAGHLILAASIFTIYFTRFFLEKNKNFLLTSLILILIVYLGNRRIAMLIVFGGIVITFIYFFIIHKKIFWIKIINVIFLLLFIMITYFYLDSQSFFDINKLNLKRNTSDYEHIYDIFDGFREISKNFFFGAGMGVEIPDRVLNHYSWDTPFHSPYIHTWVRLGFLGFLLYSSLLAYALKSLLIKKYFLKNKIILLYSTALTLISYLIFQIAFPPFYLDPKQNLFIALVFAVLFSLNSKKGNKL